MLVLTAATAAAIATAVVADLYLCHGISPLILSGCHGHILLLLLLLLPTKLHLTVSSLSIFIDCGHPFPCAIYSLKSDGDFFRVDVCDEVRRAPSQSNMKRAFYFIDHTACAAKHLFIVSS